MIITIASGKGGTGKTTLATSLAVAISDLSPVVLDCDVEGPNAHLYLRPELSLRREVNIFVPKVNADRCSGCGQCAEVCQFHAIVTLAGKVLVFPELCHGCGSCAYQCPEGAINEEPRSVGVLEGGLGVAGIRFARGTLNVGEPMAVPVIKELLRWNVFPDGGIEIRDASPGASCPVVAAAYGADFMLFVTEPTPFGLHDLRLAAQVARELDIPAGVVVNRDGVGDAGVEAVCCQEDLPILMRIPLERRIGEATARGQTLVEAFPEYRSRFVELYDRVRSLCGKATESLLTSISGFTEKTTLEG